MAQRFIAPIWALVQKYLDSASGFLQNQRVSGGVALSATIKDENARLQPLLCLKASTERRLRPVKAGRFRGAASFLRISIRKIS